MVKDHPQLSPPPDESAGIWCHFTFEAYVNLMDSHALRLTPLNAQAAGIVQPDGDARDVIPYTTRDPWYFIDYEAAAFWALPSASEEAVAVRSTYGRLKRTLAAASEDIFTGMTPPLSPSHPRDALPEPLTHSGLNACRSPFPVLCMVILHPPGNHRGAAGGGEPVRPAVLPVDPAVLVDAVVVSPLASDRFRKLVQTVTRRFDLAYAVRPSVIRAAGAHANAEHRTFDIEW